MLGDPERLQSTARDVVSAGLHAPSGEDRTIAAIMAIRERVAPPQMEEFWVALIEHSIHTLGPFLAVYGDELTTGRRPEEPSGPAVLDAPLHLVNDAFRHASAGDHAAVADVVRLIVALEDQQRAVALGNIVHMALVVGELVRGHCGTSEPAADGG